MRGVADDGALIYFEDVAEEYPGTLWAPRGLKRLVDIYTTLEYQEELEEARQRLLRDYPDSPEARAVGATTTTATPALARYLRIEASSSFSAMC